MEATGSTYNFTLSRDRLDEILNAADASFEERVGIGLAYGRALMIKAGYKGSTINEVVWMGDVVNEASKL